LNSWPVIEREFQRASRQATTWHLRLFFAAICTASLTAAILLGGLSSNLDGRLPLGFLTATVFLASLGAGAFLTSDALSAEHREGNLILLLLTPLRGRDVVLGKLVILAGQTTGAWLAISPVFMIPLLMGGIEGWEVARTLAALFSTMMLSLACGLYASSKPDTHRAPLFTSLLWLFVIGALPGVAWIFSRSNDLELAAALCAILTPLGALFHAKASLYNAPTGQGAAHYWAALGAQWIGVGIFILQAGLNTQRLARLPLAQQVVETPPASSTSSPRHGRVTKKENRFPEFWDRLMQAATSGSLLMNWLTAVWVVLALTQLLNSSEEGHAALVGLPLVIGMVARIKALMSGVQPWHEMRRSGLLELVSTTPCGSARLTEGFMETFIRRQRGLLVLLTLASLLLPFSMLVQQSGKGSLETMRTLALISAAGPVLVVFSDFDTMRWLSMKAGLSQPTVLRGLSRAFGMLYLGPCLLVTIAVLVSFKFE